MLDFTAYDRILNAPWLIERFRDRYVDRTRLKQVGLMWNACLPQYQPRCIPTEEIAETICNKWQEKNEGIYRYLVGELF